MDWNVYLRHAELLLDKGIYIHPDGYERLTFCSAHTEKDIDQFIEALNLTLPEVKGLPRESIS
jgi:glutamate-1-semialdehyde aminotransferase